MAGGDTLPEFTANPNIARQFARLNGTVVAVRIDARYLARGSETESGWVARASAPVEVLGTAEGGGGETPAGPVANGS